MSLSYMCAKFEAKTKSWLAISMKIGNGAKQPDFVQRLKKKSTNHHKAYKLTGDISFV